MLPKVSERSENTENAICGKQAGMMPKAGDGTNPPDGIVPWKSCRMSLYNVIEHLKIFFILFPVKIVQRYKKMRKRLFY